MKKFLIITKKGEITMFKNDFPEIEIKSKKEKRVSHILPRPIALRVLWLLLRLVFETLRFEKGINWLRSWKTEWILIITDRTFYFKNRDEAIDFEKSFFLEFLKKGGKL